MEYIITYLPFGIADLAAPKPPSGIGWNVVSFAVSGDGTIYHILWQRELDQLTVK